MATKSVGNLLRECRKNAKPKLAQKQVALVIGKDISYISKVEKGEIDPNFGGIETEKLAQFFREKQVLDKIIEDFVRSCNVLQFTGSTIPDQESNILQLIYNTLREVDEPKRIAYRKELRDRNDVWHGINQVTTKFEASETSFVDAKETFQRLEKLEENSTSNLKARLRLESSRILRYLGEIKLATTKFSQALELAGKAGDEILLADTLKERGDFYRRSNQDDLLLALTDYERVYQIYATRNDEAGKANAQIRIASILLTSGLLKFKHHDAVQLCDESLKSAEIRNDKYLERKSLEYKAWACSMKGEIIKAIDLQRRAHSIAIETKNSQPKELAKSITYLGGFYLICNLLIEAEKCYLDADNYVKQMLSGRSESGEEKEIFIRAIIYLGLGAIKAQRPDERIEARFYLEKSIEFSGQSNDFLTLGRAFKQLGDLDVAEDSFESAKKNYDVAKSFFQRSGLENFGNTYYLSILDLSVVDLEYRLNNYSATHQHIEQVEDRAVRLGYKELLIRCHLWTTKMLVAEDKYLVDNKIPDLYLPIILDAKSGDIQLLRLVLNTIESDLLEFYGNKKQDIIEITSKIVQLVQKKSFVSSMNKDQIREIERLESNLQTFLIEWEAMEKTLKTKKKITNK